MLLDSAKFNQNGLISSVKYVRTCASFPSIVLFCVTCANVLCVLAQCWRVSHFLDCCVRRLVFPNPLSRGRTPKTFSIPRNPYVRKSLVGSRSGRRGVAVPSPLVRRLCNGTIRTKDSVQLNMTVNVNLPTQKKLVAHGHYGSNASCRTKSPRYFVGSLEFSAVFQNCYLFYDLSRDSGWETLT
jgi:hypothetical protein